MSTDIIQTIRAEKLALRSALSREQVTLASKKILQKLTDNRHCKRAIRMGLYRSIKNEINPCLDLTFFHGKNLYLPVMINTPSPHLVLHEYTANDELLTRSFGIEEPDPTRSDSLDIAALDVLIVPLVAFDQTCNRIGFGAGYYDRSLAFKKNTPKKGPFLIGLAHQCQETKQVPANDWDIKMDMIITDERVISRTVD